MKYADLLGEWLVKLGYTHCFFVAGGGIMHLLDGFRHHFQCIPVVHEVTAGICAEHFNQTTTGKSKAFALVTTGPGLTNIVTAIAGCYVEHRALLVIAGQVKSTDLLTHPERQRGVQEVDGSSICKPITLASACLCSPIGQSEFNAYVRLSEGPHPGPVLLEVCLDVQGAAVNRDTLNDKAQTHVDKDIAPSDEEIASVQALIKNAKRPLVLFGGLVSRQSAQKWLPEFERLGLPVSTTTSAIDRIPTGSPIYAGRPGTWGGQRAANLIVAQADVLIVIGAQLDLQQTGFNFKSYAPNAKLVHIFPSRAELDRIGPPSVKKIFATADATLERLLPDLAWSDREHWNDYVQSVRQALPALDESNRSAPDLINSFVFLDHLSRAADPSDILAICSSGGTFTGALQTYEIKKNQIATTSAAHASMGYGLATAIGAAFANPSRRIILSEGEGGFSQNLQELALVTRHKLPIKIFLIDNNGYASIRATQKKFFGGAYLGCDPETGLGFPNWERLFGAYDIPCRILETNEVNVERLRALIDLHSGPEAWIVRVDPNQTNWPAVSTILHADGSISSSPLHDMLPKLSDELQARVTRYIQPT